MTPVSKPSGQTPPAEAKPGAAPAPGARIVAVLDIGSTAIRMEIAEIGPEGELRTIEALQQPAHLGKDTFARGRIEQLRAAADADLKAAYHEYDRVEKARETYKVHSLVWVDYVYALTKRVSAMKDPQILALPGANPHPPPTF